MPFAAPWGHQAGSIKWPDEYREAFGLRCWIPSGLLGLGNRSSLQCLDCDLGPRVSPADHCGPVRVCQLRYPRLGGRRAVLVRSLIKFLTCRTLPKTLSCMLPFMAWRQGSLRSSGNQCLEDQRTRSKPRGQWSSGVDRSPFSSRLPMLNLPSALRQPVDDPRQPLRTPNGDRSPRERIKPSPRDEWGAPCVSPEFDAHSQAVGIRSGVKAASVGGDQCVRRNCKMRRLRQVQFNKLFGGDAE